MAEGGRSEERPRIELWHELASTYSYLSAMRIEALAEILSRPGLEADAVLARSERPENKDRRRQQTEDAQGSGSSAPRPSWLRPSWPRPSWPRGELFWGDDRLEQALAAATGK